VTILSVALNISTWTSITDNGIDSESMVILATVMTVVVLAMIIFPTGLWLLRKSFIRCNYHNKVNPNDDNNGNDTTDNTEHKWNYHDFYHLFGSSSYIIVLVTSLILGSVRHYTPQMLLTYKSSFIILEVLLLLYYLRKTKFDSLHNLSISIESRKQYLRYIAHEIRTPLNSATLGLKLLTDTLATIENKDDLDNELCDTAGDVSKTISIAVQILADLMTFNKIEGN
jgi:hypothetical protein